MPQALEAIPTAGRSVFLMATLEPTVQASGNAHWNRMQDQVGNSAISMGGGPVRANNFLVDGFPVTDLQNRASTNPSMEAVQEMKVQVHTYDAEMGRTGGGVMNMSARSGSNDWTRLRLHGLPPELARRAAADSEIAEAAERARGVAQRRRGLRRSDPQEQDVLLVRRRKVRQQPAAAELVPRADDGRTPRRLLGADSHGRADRSFATRYTGQPFPGNIIPATASARSAQKLLNYFPTPDTEVDNGSTELQHDRPAAEQGLPVHHQGRSSLQRRGGLERFVLRQVTHEANSNYNPANKFVGASYQLDRTINTFVLNNTYILNSSTVLTLRGGYNKFNDNYNLPYEFDAAALFNNPALTSQFSDTNRFPTLTITGYKGAGFTNRQANGYYQYGGNGTLSKLMGSHNFKFGGDYRIIGVNSLNYGASTGTYTFTRPLYRQRHGRPAARVSAVGQRAAQHPELDGYVALRRRLCCKTTGASTTSSPSTTVFASRARRA